LPLAQAPAPAAPAAPGPGGPGRSVRVLIVEDNRDAAAALGTLLEFYGHEVRTAFSGAAGLALAREFDPEVVLCDLSLPGMDGFAVARALRADPATARARLIAVSGYGSAADQQRSRAAGFDLHLVKPLDADQLQGILAGEEGVA
jgi:CheY-like chemotaxis protein